MRSPCEECTFGFQIAYHEEFKKGKGKYTQIADDPETLRLLANQDKISLVEDTSAYQHGWLTPTSLLPLLRSSQTNLCAVANV